MKGEDITIIIKKIVKGGEGEHHGGAWKVAFADFMTSMMTFFLVMWLVATIVPSKKAGLANYMNTYKYSPFPPASQGKGGPVGQGFRKREPNTVPKSLKEISPQKLQSQLMLIVKAKLFDIEKKIAMRIVDKGLRIEIMDPDSNTITPAGSPELNNGAKRVIKEISDILVKFENKIMLEGHTDSLPYPTGEYTNWELSTARASAARKEFDQDDIGADRIALMSGYAATKPLVKESPADTRNRRVSVVILYSPQTDMDQADQFNEVLPVIKSLK